MTRIYLDYAATTPMRQEAIDAMLPYLSEHGHNAGSLHAEGRAAKAALDDARERVAAVLNCKAKEVIFTGSGSESDNLALLGAVAAARRPGGRIVSLPTEHHAVLHALDALDDAGYQTLRVPVDAEGRYDRDAFLQALGEDPLLASVMYVNNELGVVQPVAEIAAEVHARGGLMHTDAVQAAAYCAIDVRELGVDLLSIAAHKVYGPKGVGALYVRTGVPLSPVLFGGGQEAGVRPGTENVAGIVAFARALELAAYERDDSARRVRGIREAFEQAVLQRVPDVRINAAGAQRAPHISNLSLKGLDSEQLLMRLDLDGLAVSSGSACTSGILEPSHVIAALERGEEWTRGVLRFSFGRTTTAEEALRAVEILERAVVDLRSVSACFSAK